MNDKTRIEWANATWNPIRGCTRVSDGCRHCYAETVAAMDAGAGGAYEGLLAPGGQWNGQIAVVDSAMDQPLRWTRARKIFVNSMSDLFHERLPLKVIDRIFAVMALSALHETKGHQFQVLTKRASLMRGYLSDPKTPGRIREKIDAMLPGLPPSYRKAAASSFAWPLPNLWVGVTVENQATADERIPDLLATPAAIRWLSMEPLLGPVALPATCDHSACCDFGDSLCDSAACPARLLHWVVVGGESGSQARPMHEDWAAGLRDQCASQGIPFLFKQWGEWAPSHDKAYGMLRVGKTRAGRMLEGRLHDGYPAAAEAEGDQ